MSTLDFSFGRSFGGLNPRRRTDDVPSERARRNRLFIIGGFALLWTGVILFRLYSLQIADFETWQNWALKQHFSEVKISSERGPIVDRYGKLLAVSVPAGSVYVRPKQVKDKVEASRRVASILSIPEDAVYERMTRDKPFVWLARQIPRVDARRIEDLGISGLGYMLETRRYYPYQQSASTLLGKVGVDGHGLTGLERKFEKMLQTGELKSRVVRDAYGNSIDVSASVEDGFEIPRGDSLKLTLDADIQVILDEELERGRTAANALSAYAVLMNAHTGEVLAMSQAPSLNLNNRSAVSKKSLKNMVIESVFEPGSILKPIVAAAAVEGGVVDPDEIINCENGRLRFGRHTIKDVHPMEDIRFHDVVVRSSNIGMTKVGVRLGPERLYHALKAFGFGQSTGLNLPGETSGIFRDVRSWSKIDVATHAFGQGIAVTPVQIARAVSAIAADGVLPEVRLLQGGVPPKRKRILSAESAQAVKEMMYGVVEDEHGTGRRAAIPGVRVGGKTGTAQKARKNGRGYAEGKYIASFAGFAQSQHPGVTDTLTLVVSIDEPNTTSIYGGTLAGPVFKNVMSRVLHLLVTRSELGSNGAHNGVLPPERPNSGLMQVSYS